ncbi:AMP-binding protein [Glaciimonas sp. CA11.2]|uniref:AMP-binding protein n=1 Tax=unclassified Glaciimonas TaxID=2644401 RepID=UPI002AB3648C|nr:MULTISPECIES: AMP-binding protein [unclassified Glaciimonas]MDY7548005.1 AMP-binding protein [Glaciimonas sp. CA11.2]MEB0010175.1 AMP-binding protein [Glaciimonas sp. Cout2]MEB0084320.1 AMP-binding protein [Glaciimonas sp. Gout2]MEB0163163.1 AMP-binding protein [Glaciimonas sp. CA11.2]
MSSLLTISELLSRQARQHPDQIAFIDGDHETSYGEFDRLCNNTAAWLSDQGIGPGDRVAVWLVNRIEWLTLYFGLARLGASLVTVNTRYRSHELEYILERSQAKMLVLQLNFRKIDFPAILRDVNHAAASMLTCVAVVDADEGMPTSVLGKPTVGFHLDRLPDATVPDRGSEDALSILFTTSGTTSQPKLVMHLQRSIALHSQRAAKAYGFEDAGARLLGALPFCGVYGFNAAFAAFSAGIPVVIMDTFDAESAAQLINQHKVTHVFGSDEMYRRLVDQRGGYDPFPTARVFGFASFQPGLSEFAQESWRRRIPMTGLYGSSEVQALFSLQSATLPITQRIEGGGVPASHDAEIRIRDVDTGELLPAGVSGVIEIRAQTNFAGYLDNLEATEKAIDKDGFFRTGDVGLLREDGSFVYQTRLGDAIRLGGYLVSPVEIEDVLKAMPGVADVQVVAVDIARQIRSVAFVIALPNQVLQESEMIATAAASMAGFKVPARIWMVDEFPTTQSPNGIKIQRAKLREMALQRIAQA